MKTILRLLKLAGGYRPLLYLRVENPPYLPLVLAATSVPGPLGLRTLSLTHYAPYNDTSPAARQEDIPPSCLRRSYFL